MRMIHREDQGSTTILRIEHGKVNALDLELVEALAGEIAATARAAAGAIVLTGTGGTFSAGVDLFRVLDGGGEYIRRFLPRLEQLFRDLFLHPRPVVAAVNGHAIAGGCLLACACDRRLIAAGGARVGVPELRVGVPFPATAFEVLRFATGDRDLERVAYTGTTFAPDEAKTHGLVDEVVPVTELLERAVHVAGEMAAIPADAFRLAKQQARAPALERCGKLGPDFSARVLETWMSPTSTDAIRSYLERTLGNSRKRNQDEQEG